MTNQVYLGQTAPVAPTSPQATHDRARLLAKQGDVEGACAAYGEAMAFGHQTCTVLAAIDLAELLGSHGDIEGARAAYRTAIGAAPDGDFNAPRAACGLARLLAKQGNIDGARAVYGEAIGFGHETFTALAAIELADMLGSYGDIEGARAAYRTAIGVASDGDFNAPRAACGLANLLAAQGDVVGASAAYDEAMAFGNQTYISLAAMGAAKMLDEHGDVVGAHAAYRTAIETGSASVAAYCAGALAAMLERGGDLVGARSAYQEAIDRAGGPAKAAHAVDRLRRLGGRIGASGLDQFDGVVAHGPAIPAVFALQPDLRIDQAVPVGPQPDPGDIWHRIADLAVLIGSGELASAEPALSRWCEEVETSKRSDWWSGWPFLQLVRVHDLRGDLPAAAATLKRYRDRVPGAVDDSRAEKLAEKLAAGERPALSRNPLYPWGQHNGALTEILIDDPQFHDAALFSRPLPQHAAGGARFVLVGGPMCYVDRRGEHSCTTGESIEGSEAMRLSEDTSRVFTLTESATWTAAAVEVSHRLLGAAQRCGDSAAWAVATGYVDAGFRATMKALGERPPRKLKADNRVLRKPPRGRWLYHDQPATFVLHQHSPDALYQVVGDPPRVALWRWPDRSDLVLHAWCDTLVASSSSPVTIVLPDTPMLRDFARRYVRGELMGRIDRTYLENAVHFGSWEVPNQRGSACYMRMGPRLIVDPDGAEWDGDLLTVALDYLEARYHLRIPPFDAIRDSLFSGILTGHLDAVRDARSADTAWRPDELRLFAHMRDWYSHHRTTRAPGPDLFAVHEPAGPRP